MTAIHADPRLVFLHEVDEPTGPAAGRALAAVHAYAAAVGVPDSVHATITDLTTDLMHLCDALGIDTAEVRAHADRAHASEIGDPS